MIYTEWVILSIVTLKCLPSENLSRFIVDIIPEVCVYDDLSGWEGQLLVTYITVSSC